MERHCIHVKVIACQQCRDWAGPSPQMKSLYAIHLALLVSKFRPRAARPPFTSSKNFVKYSRKNSANFIMKGFENNISTKGGFSRTHRRRNLTTCHRQRDDPRKVKLENFMRTSWATHASKLRNLHGAGVRYSVEKYLGQDNR